MTRSERLAINSPALPPQALMVFDITDNLFYYFDGAKWNGLVPKQEQSVYPGNPNVKGNIVLDSGSVVATDITLTGDANVGGNLNVNGFSTNALVPTGTIIMWSGNETDIPAGWGLCNGHYRTINGGDYGTTPPGFSDPNLLFAPDLRGRFIVGYDDRAGDPGNGYWDANYNNAHGTGGQKNVVLTQGNLPPHQHTVNNGTDGGTVSISTAGDHNHSYDMRDDDDNGDDNSGYPETGKWDGGSGGGSTNNAGLHSHNIGGNTGDGTSLGLNSAPVNNLPPYFVIVYLIKLP
jgi:microcystin-dependent protein